MHHRKIYEHHHQGSLLPGIEIHHIDGDPENNNPSNLLAVTIEEHLAIHQSQEDWGAVQAILMRMENSSEDIADAARKKQLQLLADGEHNFQKMTKERRREISKKAGTKVKETGVGIFRIHREDPELARANSANAGRAAQKKRRENPELRYLNTLQGKAVKNTKWYYNTVTNEKARCHVRPEGSEWVEGMGPLNVEPERKWWCNKTTGQRIMANKMPQGDGWTRGLKYDKSE